MAAKITIVPANAIDASKWDQCIERHQPGLIYSRYDYLEGICDDWHGLVIDDYEAVMALPWKKKMGIRYLYHPPFVQQLGIIGTSDSNAVLKAVYSFIKYGDILFNFGNSTAALSHQATSKTNFIIDLSDGYEAIYNRYSKDLQQNLKKAQRAAMVISHQPQIELAIAAYRSIYHDRFSQLSSSVYERFKKICESYSEKNMCFTRSVSGEKGELLSIALFLQDSKRIYNVMNSTTEAGRKLEANHFLLDAVIKEFAGQKLIFDFEGSDLPGVKSFYEKFGSINQPYFHYHFNNLPGILRLFRR